MKKEKIGFFGGCFNPPTIIHIGLAQKLIKDGILDKVIFVPVGDYYNKQNLVLAEHRYNMLVLSCKNYKDLSVENIASSNKDLLYTIDTLNLIKDKYKNKDIFFIMGSDNFQKLPNWKNYNEIIEKYKFIVVERFGYEEICNSNKIIYYKTNQTEDISSSSIRKMLKDNQDVQKWINKETLKYIKENNIYV